MTRSMAYAGLLAYIATAIAVIAARPEWLANSNEFLKSFVNHELINVLGVTLAITLASAAQIHLALNRIEERHGVRNALDQTRSELRHDTYWLLAYFVFGIVIVVVKPIAGGGVESEAFFNAAALYILILHILVLVSLTQLVFSIEPELRDIVVEDDDPTNYDMRP